MPAGLQGQASVSQVALTLVTRGTGLGDSTPPTAATESLQAVTVAWVEGGGFGDGTMSNTVGQPCGSTGATWNQPNCTGGAVWSGGAVAATSGTAMVPAALSTAVTWDSAASGNAGMVADVQSWLDAPDTNHGWEISSSTEGTTGEAQRFYSREGSGQGPSLSVTFVCTSNAEAGCAAPVDGGASDAGQAHDASDGSPSTGDGPSGIGGGASGCECSFADRDRAEPCSGALLGLAFLAFTGMRATRRRSSVQK